MMFWKYHVADVIMMIRVLMIVLMVCLCTYYTKRTTVLSPLKGWRCAASIDQKYTDNALFLHRQQSLRKVYNTFGIFDTLQQLGRFESYFLKVILSCRCSVDVFGFRLGKNDFLFHPLYLVYPVVDKKIEWWWWWCQTCNLSTILHDRIFWSTILHSKNT